MEQRIPNQYKPTFFESLFSAFIPVPTKRILSDKKIEKQKKINLSLTQAVKQKSSQKIKISISEKGKNTPQTYLRSNQFSSEQVTIKRSTNDRNKGLNFHPRKISFQNQHTLKPKFKSQLMLQPSPSQTFRNNQSSEKSRSYILSLDKNADKASTKLSYEKTKIQVVGNQFTKANESDSFKKRIEGTSNFFNSNIKNTFSSITQTCDKKVNPELSLNIDNSFNKAEKQIKTRTESFQSDQPKQIQKLFFKDFDENKLNFNTKNSWQSRISSVIKTDPAEPHKFEQLPTKTQISENYNNLSMPAQQLTELMLQTPKNEVRKHTSKQIMFQNLSQQQNQIRQKINNLFDHVETIQSKNDQSSLGSESDCYSNVIERITGSGMAKWRNTQRDFVEDEQKSQKKEKLRKTLYANLLSKFQQNIQKQNQDQNSKMDFKKKNMPSERKYVQDSKQNDQSLARIEDIFIDSKLSVSPPSSTQKNKLKLNRGSLNFEPSPKISSANIYQFFEKLCYLGVGRFASVYLCLDSSINYLFAMKQILKFTVNCNKLQKQLQKQILIQQSCSHPNVLNLYNVWSDEKKYYLALEYGQTTLLKIIENQRKGLEESRCIRYLFEILQGLQYLHGKGIIHRDIKPENIIMVNDCCKIGDFGWATLNQAGYIFETCGTPVYISPQIEKLESYSHKTDIWSLGILAYELINGKLSQDFFKSQNILNAKLLRYANQVSNGYKKLIQLLLSEKEEDRPQAHEILSLQIFHQK